MSSRIAYIPNGTTIQNQPLPKDLAKKKLGLPDSKKIVLYVGVFYERKNISLLIESWQDIGRRHPDALLVLVGDGPLRKTIETKIIDLNLRHSVLCPGYFDNVDDYFSASDFFVLPSNIEGCSNALLEAMSHKCACIASDYPWNTEIIQHRTNGLLFQPNNAAMLTQYLSELLENDDLRKHLGRAAFDTIINKFSLEATADLYYNLYQNILRPDKIRRNT